MQPEPHHQDLSRDPILDGRDSLRLVKLRLALTLIAVAVLPIAAVSPLVRAVAEEGRAAHHDRLVDQARTVAAMVEGEIATLRREAAELLDQPVLVKAAAQGATASARRAATDGLEHFVEAPGSALTAATLVTGKGVRAAFGPAVDMRSLPPGVLVSGLAALPGDPTRILVVETSEAGGGPARTLVAAVSMPALLAAATPQADLPGRVLRIADATGRVLAESTGPFDPGALPGEVLDLATMAARESDGRMQLDLPGIDGWQVVVGAPIPLVAMPVQALSALGAMLVLLVGFTIWMARQILRPARALENSRSRLRELYESAREAALRDSLTGLGNHRAFQEAVARMVEGARRYGTAFSLVLIDIDEFKRINDTKGHATGDQLLSEVGALISSTIRHTDAAYRIGGDEFALLLPHTDASGAIVVARRLLARGLEDRVAGLYRWPISFSAGVTACPEYGTTRLELTSQADAALYRGKRTGRTVVTIYDPEKDHGHVDDGMRAELSSAISAVIEASTLTPVYQPVIDLNSGRVIGYEGLVRVPKASTFAHTGALFDAAEVAGRVADLDRAALDVVLRSARSMDETMSLSVNVSPRTLESPEFTATAFLSILRRHGMAPGRVILELTEREAIRDPDRLRNMLLTIQNAGVRVAADDVGAGNAGLRLLSQFRFDVVKIDLSLVQRAGDDRTHSVLRSIVEVATRMGATTTAEGVETSGQLRTARRLGITAGQGYLLGRPGPDRDLTWVDIAALEQRDDVPIPVTADLADLPDLTAPSDRVDRRAERRGDRRSEPPRWPGAAPVDDVDNPLLPPLDATGHLVTSKRGALSFLRATRQTHE
ncbi:MAG TPA: bifunctional diguanylate cyclase/phosphodiesterase [Candidatus Limnocylindrales bacterium]|nr:bifunctional diguanylate cyclase/phosphodiesterase [Candidatus Limnocylindrales bacterium]